MTIVPHEDGKKRGIILRIIVAIALPLLVAIVAIPNFLRARMSPGEATFVGSVRMINTAEVTYAATYPKAGFSPTLQALGGTAAECEHVSEQHACLIDDVLASGVKGGYRFTYALVPAKDAGPVAAYTIHADPMPQKPDWLERLFGVKPQSAHRHLYSDQSAVIRSERDKEANAQSPPLQ